MKRLIVNFSDEFNQAALLTSINAISTTFTDTTEIAENHEGCLLTLVIASTNDHACEDVYNRLSQVYNALSTEGNFMPSVYEDIDDKDCHGMTYYVEKYEKIEFSTIDYDYIYQYGQLYNTTTGFTRLCYEYEVLEDIVVLNKYGTLTKLNKYEDL